MELINQRATWGVLRHFIRFYPNDQRQDPMEEEIVEGFLWIFTVFSILFIVVTYKTLQYLEANYTRIRREWRFLDALSKDFQKANQSVKEIKEKANEVWESELNLRGITQTLSEIYTRWLEKQGKVTADAQRCVEEYRRLILESNERNVLKKYISVLKKCIQIADLALGMRRIKEELESQLKEMNEYTKPIVEKLEELRIKVRKLQDRPIKEAEAEQVNDIVCSGVASLLEGLITGKPSLVRGIEEQVWAIVMELKLLGDFMKELGRHRQRLESEIEKAWVEEAKQIVDQGQKTIKTLLEDAEHANPTMKWLSLFREDWILRPKLKKSVKDFGNNFSYLLETKERYGFEFYCRVLSKKAAINTSTDVVDNDAAVHRARNVNRSQVDSGQEQNRSSQVAGEQLNDLETKLNMLENEVRATDMIQVGLQFLKQMASGEPVLSNDALSLSLLRRWIQVYRIKVIEESCSLVGLEENIHNLILELTTNNGQNRTIISIVGMRGIGKKTLAREIFNHRSIQSYFPDGRRLFFSLPNDISETELLKSVLKSVGSQIPQTHDQNNETDFIKNLRNFLNAQSKSLIVLENLCKTEHWEKLRREVFSDEIRSSMVMLITTRDKAVASHANASSIHQLRLRTGEESWEFFTQMVLCPAEDATKKLAKKVVARTGGLPLEILRLGYLLSGRTVTEEELKAVLERMTQGYSHNPWRETWDTNKEDLAPNLIRGKCLSYFELFPRDSEVPARRLVALWVAQGLAQSDTANDSRTHESVAYDYLVELVDRNIIQVIKRKLNGKVSTCRLPSALRDFWLKSRRSTTRDRSWSLCASLDRKLAYRFDDDDASCSPSIHGFDRSRVGQDETRPLSITFIDTREGNSPGEDIGKFLRKGIKTGRLLHLMVLDLEGVHKPQLPSSIGRLKNLTHLGLRWTDIDSLPSSIGELLNLQILDLKKTQLRKLPSSIWKLKKLRQLHLGQNCRIESMPRSNDISMTNLHELSGAYLVDEGRALIDELHKFNNLRKLKLKFHLTPQLQTKLAERILQLTNLESLTLKCANESSEPQTLYLEPLKDLTQLTSLNLFGKIENKSIMFSLPITLTELTLSSSGLNSRESNSRGLTLLETLGTDLPELKFLSFLGGSYCEMRMVFSTGFPKLLVLNIFNLPNLEDLVVEEEALKNLRMLNIRSCERLRAPSGLINLSSLQELSINEILLPEFTAKLSSTSPQVRNILRII